MSANGAAPAEPRDGRGARAPRRRALAGAVGAAVACLWVGTAAHAAAQTNPPVRPDALRPATLRYRVTVAGTPVGTVTTSLERGAERDRELYRATSEFATDAGERQNVEVLFDAHTFAPLRTAGTGRQGGYHVRLELRYDDGRVRGHLDVAPPDGPPDSTRHVDVELPPGTIDQNQLRYVLASAPLEVGYRFEVPVFDITRVEVQTLALRVTSVETVHVPAGRFRAYRIEMTGGDLPMTWYVSTEAPRRVLRQRFEAGGATVEVDLLP